MLVARAVELEALEALALMFSITLSLISPAPVLVLCSAQDCQALALILGLLLDGGAIPPVAHRRRVPFQLVAHGPGDGHPWSSWFHIVQVLLCIYVFELGMRP